MLLSLFQKFDKFLDTVTESPPTVAAIEPTNEERELEDADFLKMYDAGLHVPQKCQDTVDSVRPPIHGVRLHSLRLCVQHTESLSQTVRTAY